MEYGNYLRNLITVLLNTLFLLRLRLVYVVYCFLHIIYNRAQGPVYNAHHLICIGIFRIVRYSENHGLDAPQIFTSKFQQLIVVLYF